MEEESPVPAPVREPRSLPWVEKYRPRTVRDISYQEEVVTALRSSIESGRLPHLLFYGPPGTGKTSTILAFCREIFGSAMKQRVLELNASDERGIAVIREKVKQFAQLSVSTANPRIPPYKIIILDEADAMTSDAQSALRRIIESSTRITRFCLICNYISRIINPLTSRCAKFRFKALPEESIVARLRFVAEKEGLNYPPPVRLSPSPAQIYKTLIAISGGDLRKAIHYLQSASLLSGGQLEASDLLDIGGFLPPARLEALMRAMKTRAIDSVETEVKALVQDGFSASRIASQLLGAIVSDISLEDRFKAQAALALAELDYGLTRGCDEYLQLMSALARAIVSTPVAIESADS